VPSNHSQCSRLSVRGSRSGRVVARALAVAAAAAAFAASKPAEALPLLTLSGSVRGLYGSATGDQDLNPYGPGLGLRAGVTLPLSLYLGASLDWFAGESDSVAGIDTSASLLQVLANVGYDVGFGPLTLRPVLGLGLAQAKASVGDVDSTEGDFVLSPGAELSVGLGLLSVGGELRYNHIFVDGDGNADGLIIGVGLGFSI
jgi:outer membrane protein with beta-barrel domain